MNSIEIGPFRDADGYVEAASLDAADPLSDFRSQFVFDDSDLIYLDGNSLGRQPIEAQSVLDNVIQRQWSQRLIRSWNEGWWELQLALGDRLAPILGAEQGEVIISDATSVNLYKLAHAAVKGRPDRTRIITDDLNFPTDIYVLDGIARSNGLELVVVEADGISGPLERLHEAIDTNTALVSLSHTTFKSGYTYDMAEINQIAHKVGALVLWDTSHSVGAVPIDLAGTDTDLAIGCTYKYLNGGPGSPAFLYVRTDLQPELENPITAWWAHSTPFTFDLEFTPVDGIRKFHTGTMPMLSMAAIGPGIDTVLAAGMPAIRRKSVDLSEFLISQWESHLEPIGFGLASPRDAARRGSHISVSHPDSRQITLALIELCEVIPDFRAPDNVRLGLSPLYTSFVEVHTAVQRLRRLVENGWHKSLPVSDSPVT